MFSDVFRCIINQFFENILGRDIVNKFGFFSIFHKKLNVLINNKLITTFSYNGKLEHTFD